MKTKKQKNRNHRRPVTNRTAPKTQTNAAAYSAKAMKQSIQSKVSVEILFSSGIVKMIPTSTYYTGIHPGNNDCLQVCVTRKTQDGSTSFFLAAVKKNSGEILSCMVEFCLEKELFDKSLKMLNLAPYEDKKSVEQFLHDAAKAHKALGLDYPLEFTAGMSILEYTPDEFDDLTCGHLATFQTKLSHSKASKQKKVPEQNKPSAFDSTFSNQPASEQSDQPDYPPAYENDPNRTIAIKYLQLFNGSITNIPEYDPDFCKNWNRERWIEFLNEEYPMDQEVLQSQKVFQPLMTIYEKTFLAIPESDPAIMKELDWLENHPAELTDDANLEKLALTDPEEARMVTIILCGIEYARKEGTLAYFSTQLEATVEMYPNLESISILLFQLYMELNYNKKSYRLACRLYNNGRNREVIIPNYFYEILGNQKTKLLQEFLKDSVLFERHLPASKTTISKNAYLFYYYSLAVNLSNNNQWVEFSKLMNILYQITDKTKDPEFQNKWRDLKFRSVVYMNYFLITLRQVPEKHEPFMEEILDKLTSNN